MQLRLDYGRGHLPVELPDDRLLATLEYSPAEPLADAPGAVRACLNAPLGTPPLAELASGRRNACIAVCDITRPVPNELLLTPVLATLEAAGIAREQITILIATGLHRPNHGEELIEILGRRIAENYRVENHHGQQRSEHTYLGESPRGVPVWIDSRWVEADLKISIGLIEPHLMAGYSGGRKLICPGLAAVETVRAWHSPAFLEHPLADCGHLEGNPVHEENTWIARRAGCDFIVNTVLDTKRRPLKIVAGDMEQAFLEGVKLVREISTAQIPEPVDIVVTSSAGYPLDTTFYQSVKAMTGALPIVKAGGTIIVAASLTEGIGGPEFQSLFHEHASLESFSRRILDKDYFVIDQWQLEELAKVRRRAEVVMVSDGLSAETLAGLFVRSAPTVEAAIATALQQHGPRARIAAIPKGPYVLAQVAA